MSFFTSRRGFLVPAGYFSVTHRSSGKKFALISLLTYFSRFCWFCLFICSGVAFARFPRFSPFAPYFPAHLYSYSVEFGNR